MSEPDPRLSTEQFGHHARNTAWVATSQVARFREYDRRAADFPGSHEVIDRIKDDIAKGIGIKEPLIMGYDHREGRASLVEGNHRLNAAEESGLTHVPVRVYRTRAAVGGKEPDLRPEPDWSGYVPGDMHPSVLFHAEHLFNDRRQS